MGGFMNRKKLFQWAKGFRGRSKNCYRLATRRVEKALQHSYVGRKQKKRQFRSLWISRVNAGVREYGITYGRFIHGMSAPDVQVELNRKIMAQLAIYEPFSFRALVDTVKTLGRVPEKHYPDYGHINTAVNTQMLPVTRHPRVQVWSQVPAISDAYYKAQAKRLDAIAQEQAEKEQEEAEQEDGQEEDGQKQEGGQ